MSDDAVGSSSRKQGEDAKLFQGMRCLAGPGEVAGSDTSGK